MSGLPCRENLNQQRKRTLSPVRFDKLTFANLGGWVRFTLSGRKTPAVTLVSELNRLQQQAPGLLT
jgi:hypothetical protein